MSDEEKPFGSRDIDSNDDAANSEGSNLADIDPPAEEDGRNNHQIIWQWVRPRLPMIVAVSAAVLTVVGTLAASWVLAGPVSTIVYVLLFAAGAGGIPTFIYMMGASIPRVIGKPLGKGMFILQQMAFGTGYLVETDKDYKMCPGRDGEVFVNGEWREVEAQENMTVAGWQPFGSVRYKDRDTLEKHRVDNPQTDGGTPGVGSIASMGLDDVVRSADVETQSRTRGGFEETDNPTRSHGGWLVDLVSLYNDGLRKMGNISVIEKSEEVAMREQAKEGAASGNEPLIGSIVGLLLGLVTGYVMFMA